METLYVVFLPHSVIAEVDPYSLGILIEWKHKKVGFALTQSGDPYSLGILIEWKLSCSILTSFTNRSLLARDIN